MSMRFRAFSSDTSGCPTRDECPTGPAFWARQGLVYWDAPMARLGRAGGAALIRIAPGGALIGRSCGVQCLVSIPRDRTIHCSY
jgi:hypothetical protein